MTTVGNDLPPLVRQVVDSFLPEQSRLVIEELGDRRLYLAKVGQKFLREERFENSKQMIVRRDNVGRIRWMRNGAPAD